MSLSTLGTHVIADRSFRCSEWTAGHLTSTVARLAKAHPTARLHIIQATFSEMGLSAGTHSGDCVFDVRIIGLAWWDAQRFLRSCGWAAWFRHTGTWADPSAWHIHMASIPAGLSGRPTAAQVGAAYKKLGLKVGKYIDGGVTSTGSVVGTSQVADYFAHALGLAGQHASGGDKSWFPPNIAATIYSPSAAQAAAKETTVAERAKTLTSHIVNGVNTDRQIDLDDLDALIRIGHQPEAQAAKDFRDAIIAGYRIFNKAVD